MVGEAAAAHLRGTAFGLFGPATGVVVLDGNAVAVNIRAVAGSQVMFAVGAALSGLAVLLAIRRAA